MRKVLVLGLFLASLSFLTYAQQDDMHENIRSAVKAGNAQGLGLFFSDYLEVKTEKKEGSFSKNQSVFFLKEFFEDNKPKDFIYDFKGSTANGSKYAIGTYSSTGGNYRVYMKWKMVDKEYLIDAIDFTKEDDN